MVIVCGTDLSERSKPAQRAAAAIARRTGAELCLVYIVDPTTSLVAPDTDAEVREAAASRLDAHARELREHMGDDLRLRTLVPPVSKTHQARSVAEALVRFAVEQGASLIVVSSQGHGASPLVSIGGTSERVAQVSPVAVLVVRDDQPFLRWAEDGRGLRVLLGVDRSATTEAAVAWTKQLREAGPCEIVVGHVYYMIDSLRRYGLPSRVDHTKPDPELEELIARDVAALTGTFPGEGEVLYQPILGLGRLGDHLLSVADSKASELIVVGTRQGRGLRRLASVSSVVLHHGHASVACIPTAAVRQELRAPHLRRILVPTDLSPNGNVAAAYGYSLATGPDGEVHLVHVMPPSQSARDRRSDAEVAAELRGLVPESERQTFTRAHVLRADDVPRAICELAERLGVDAICLSAQPHTVVKQALLGSTADRIARETSRPIFLVRPKAP